jgi:hypothetical protein
MSRNDITYIENKEVCEDELLVYLGKDKDGGIRVMTRKDFYIQYPRDAIYESDKQQYKVILVIDTKIPKEFGCFYRPMRVNC